MLPNTASYDDKTSHLKIERLSNMRTSTSKPDITYDVIGCFRSSQGLFMQRKEKLEMVIFKKIHVEIST